jgi:signal transduction histidine kinase
MRDRKGTTGRADEQGLGLAMTRDRLHEAYDDYRFSVEARTEGGVRVVIELPVEGEVARGRDVDASAQTASDSNTS